MKTSYGKRLSGKPIGSKWVLTTNRNPAGTIRYKARSAIKGYTARLGGNLCTAIDHMDVVTAFLNPEVDDPDLYMAIPEGWDSVSNDSVSSDSVSNDSVGSDSVSSDSVSSDSVSGAASAATASVVTALVATASVATASVATAAIATADLCRQHFQTTESLARTKASTTAMV